MLLAVFLKSTTMGYIKHHSIIVSGWQEEKVKEAHQKAIEIFENEFNDEPYEKPFGSRLISPIISGLTNSQDSFFIAPDGSKEGWGTSDSGDNARKLFLDWLQNSSDNYCEYVEIIFGGDSDQNEVIRCKDSDLNG